MSQETATEQPVEAIPVTDETEQKHTRRTRSRKKPVEEAAEQNGHTNGHVEGNGLAEGEVAETKRQWIKRFGFWKDNEAGVRIEEDRQNKLHTIISREPLPAQAVELLEERGLERDREGGGYSKKISHLRPAESRELAEQTVLDVTNVVRAEKGLEERASFFISRS